MKIKNWIKKTSKRKKKLNRNNSLQHNIKSLNTSFSSDILFMFMFMTHANDILFLSIHPYAHHRHMEPHKKEKKTRALTV